MRDWKIVFKTRSYYYIFIKQNKDSNYLDFFYQHQYDIEKEKSFFFLMPNSIELEKGDSKEYIHKYAPALKKFMDSPDKTTLFAEEDVLKAIVKEEKRSNFFKFLSKKKKNIVLFCHQDLDQSAQNPDYIHTYMTREDLELQLSLFQHFNKIKNAIQNTHNPFKNPIAAYQKFQQET
jgi:hypothetical protein